MGLLNLLEMISNFAKPLGHNPFVSHSRPRMRGRLSPYEQQQAYQQKCEAFLKRFTADQILAFPLGLQIKLGLYDFDRAGRKIWAYQDKAAAGGGSHAGE